MALHLQTPAGSRQKNMVFTFDIRLECYPLVIYHRENGTFIVDLAIEHGDVR